MIKTNKSLWLLIATLALTSKVGFAVEMPSDKVEFLNGKPVSKKLPFSEIVRVENTLYLSGQIGVQPNTGKLVQGGFEAEAVQTLTNIKSSLQRYGYSMNNVVKCTVMLTNIGDFTRFNQVYSRFFTPPYPARSAFAVNQLALNASVEVECIASVLN